MSHSVAVGQKSWCTKAVFNLSLMCCVSQLKIAMKKTQEDQRYPQPLFTSSATSKKVGCLELG